MLRFVDISSWNPVVDFAALKAGGVDGVSIKCTGGTSYRNPEYTKQLAGARAAGLLVEHYHYWVESTVDGYPGKGPEAEADFFLSQIDWRPGEPVDLDFEDPAMRGDQSGAVARWRDRVRDTLGITALFYANVSDISLRILGGAVDVTDMPLWLAWYWNSGLDHPAPTCPKPWLSYVAWQWSGGGPVPGIPNPTDADWFYGDAAQWRALGTPPDELPQKPPAPPADPGSVRASIDAQGHTHLDLDFGGIATSIDGYTVVDAGVSITNAKGEKWSRTFRDGQFLDWHQ